MNKLIENTELFISAIETRPPIYNFLMEVFRDKKLVEKLWEEIAAEFDTKVEYCKAKWVSLRSSLSRQMRNEERNETRNIKINDWYLLEKMFFMREFMRRRRKRRHSDEDVENPHNNSSTKSNSSVDARNQYNATFLNTEMKVKNEPFLKSESESTTSVDDFDFEKMTSQANFMEPSNVCVELSKSETDKIRNQFQIHADSVDRPDCTFRHFPFSFKGRSDERESAMECINRIRIDTEDSEPFPALEKKIEEQENPPLPTVITKLNEQEDSNLTFLKSILPDFNKLTGRRQRLLKQEILQNLNKLLDEQENES